MAVKSDKTEQNEVIENGNCRKFSIDINEGFLAISCEYDIIDYSDYQRKGKVLDKDLFFIFKIETKNILSVSFSSDLRNSSIILQVDNRIDLNPLISFRYLDLAFAFDGKIEFHRDHHYALFDAAAYLFFSQKEVGKILYY